MALAAITMRIPLCMRKIRKEISGLPRGMLQQGHVQLGPGYLIEADLSISFLSQRSVNFLLFILQFDTQTVHTP